jgi:hypothetical protein
MKCCHCESDLVWESDHSFDSYLKDGKGTVSNFVCPNEKCATKVLVFREHDNDE